MSSECRIYATVCVVVKRGTTEWGYYGTRELHRRITRDYLYTHATAGNNWCYIGNVITEKVQNSKMGVLPHIRGKMPTL